MSYGEIDFGEETELCWVPDAAFLGGVWAVSYYSGPQRILLAADPLALPDF